MKFLKYFMGISLVLLVVGGSNYLVIAGLAYLADKWFQAGEAKETFVIGITFVIVSAVVSGLFASLE